MKLQKRLATVMAVAMVSTGIMVPAFAAEDNSNPTAAVVSNETRTTMSVLRTTLPALQLDHQILYNGMVVVDSNMHLFGKNGAKMTTSEILSVAGSRATVVDKNNLPVVDEAGNILGYDNDILVTADGYINADIIQYSNQGPNYILLIASNKKDGKRRYISVADNKLQKHYYIFEATDNEEDVLKNSSTNKETLFRYEVDDQSETFAVDNDFYLILEENSYDLYTYIHEGGAVRSMRVAQISTAGKVTLDENTGVEGITLGNPQVKEEKPEGEQGGQEGSGEQGGQEGSGEQGGQEGSGEQDGQEGSGEQGGQEGSGEQGGQEGSGEQGGQEGGEEQGGQEEVSSINMFTYQGFFPSVSSLKGKKVVIKSTGKTLVDKKGNIYDGNGQIIANSQGEFLSKKGEVLIDAAGNLLLNGQVAVKADGSVNTDIAKVITYSNGNTDFAVVNKENGQYLLRHVKDLKGDGSEAILWVLGDKEKDGEYILDQFTDKYGNLALATYTDGNLAFIRRATVSSICFEGTDTVLLSVSQGETYFNTEYIKKVSSSSSSSSSSSGNSSNSNSSNNSSSSDKKDDTKKDETKKDEVKQDDTKKTEETKQEDQSTTTDATQAELTEEEKTVSDVAKEVISTQTRVLTNKAIPQNFAFTYNNAPVVLKHPVMVEGGRSMLPVRDVAEMLGMKVGFDAATKTAIVVKDGVKMEFPLGMSVAIVNGEKVAIDQTNLEVKTIVVNGTTYLPVRFIAEQLGLTVSFDKGNVAINNK